MKRILLTVCTALVLAAVTPTSAQRRDNKESANTRSVQGVVADGEDNPLEGAVVQLKDSKSLQIRSFITRNNGAYHFHGLNPDTDYELKADFQGKTSASKTLSSFDSRKQAVMNLKIEK
jgi:protocatechuate 3,4-dioxygenase beta subunit